MSNLIKTVLKDITEHIHESNVIVKDPSTHDVFVVTANLLYTKEQRRLNRQLGLHKIKCHKSVK